MSNPGLDQRASLEYAQPKLVQTRSTELPVKRDYILEICDRIVILNYEEITDKFGMVLFVAAQSKTPASGDEFARLLYDFAKQYIADNGQ